ncbi:MAG: PIG-L family deacetylase [Acidimicrobiia bacterium]|nr:PIG-L family deacetylase [Acidimicrobiia bacterium]
MTTPWLERVGKALVLCPHTDDEFGCAGTIVRLVEAGAEVRYIALSRCEESVPAGLPDDVLERECRACTADLGIAPDRCEVWDFRVRHFPAARQEILERLVSLSRKWAPDLVLMPSWVDTHQDHATVAAEGFRAFKHSSILGYELPQNLVSFESTAFVKLTSAVLDRKVRALQHYRSQEARPYSSEQFIRSLATVRGAQCGAPYAEAFGVVRMIV